MSLSLTIPSIRPGGHHTIVSSLETAGPASLCGDGLFRKDGYFKVSITPQELNSFLHNDFTGFVVNK